MYSHPETFLRLDELGERFPPYEPTFDFPGRFIDLAHRFYADCPVNAYGMIQIKSGRWFNPVIRGWLRRDDALKLYEMAYFAQGNILEFGSYDGLSTSILSQANQNAPDRVKIITADLDQECVRRTLRTLRAKRLARDVDVRCEDAAEFVETLTGQQQQFGFIFVDHAHDYESVYRVCRKLRGIMRAGAFCLFHDFNDTRNREGAERFGVYQGVCEGLDANQFEFFGVYGCTALYRAI